MFLEIPRRNPSEGLNFFLCARQGLVASSFVALFLKRQLKLTVQQFLDVSRFFSPWAFRFPLSLLSHGTRLCAPFLSFIFLR